MWCGHQTFAGQRNQRAFLRHAVDQTGLTSHCPIMSSRRVAPCWQCSTAITRGTPGLLTDSVQAHNTAAVMLL